MSKYLKNEHLEYPEISLYELLERSAEKHPSNISYNYFGTKKTYKEFLKQIDNCARAFLSLGIKKNDAVSICMPNTPEAVISFYAVNKIGAVANMIHPLSAEAEIKYYVNLVECKFIIAVDISFNKINHIFNETKLKNIILVSAGDSMPFYMRTGYKLTQGRKLKLENNKSAIKWKDFIKLGKEYTNEIKPCSKSEDTAVILYSGGTTGYPKGIELTNMNFNALAMQSFEACACLKEKDTVLAVMPVFHGFGLGICIHTVQYFGGTSILVPQFRADTFDKLLIKYKPNIIAGVPTLYEALLKNKNLDNADLSFLKCVISGGDSLSVSLKKRIDKFLHMHGADIQVREGYGLTECVTGSCLTPENYYREGSIGVPYPDTYYKIVKTGTTDELPFGEEGEITISGPSVMKGYYNNAEETMLALKKHSDGKIWLHTGDLGCMDEDGFIYFRQRQKRVIVSSGYNIYPQYIENIIDSHPDVLVSCVIGIDHPYKIQAAKAFIVLKDGKNANDEMLNSIKALCVKNLAKFSLPYEYEFIDELPKTLVGKVAYKELTDKSKFLKKDKLTFLLIHPEISRTKYNFKGIIENECLELEYISSILKEKGHRVFIYDGQVETISVPQALKNYQPDVVYVCGRTRQENFMLEYCRNAKEYSSRTITIIGGLHAQLCSERMYKEYVDYILTTFDVFKILDIIDYAVFKKISSVDSIDGICFKENGSWRRNKSVPFDINNLPLPDRSYFYEHPDNYRYLELEHSAWVRTAYCCPYRCSFCNRNKMNCGRYVCRNIESVVDEIQNIKSDNIYIVDDDFLFDEKRLNKFAELLAERNIRKKYICYGRADFIASHKDLMKKLRDAGLYYVLTGLEAVDERYLAEYNKQSDLNNNIRSIEICNELGINIMGMFILDLDFTRSDFVKLYKWIVEHNLSHTAVSIFTPELCTETYNRYKDSIITENPSHFDYLHLVAKPSKLSVRRFYFYYYVLLIKLFLKAKKEGVYDFIDYNEYIASFISNLFRKRKNDDE